MNDKTYNDNTRVGAYKKCPRSYMLRHVYGWAGTGKSVALANGQGWHDGMDVIWEHIGSMDDKSLADGATEAWRDAMLESDIPIDDMSYALKEKRNEGVIRELFTNYIKQRKPFLVNDIELLACERPFMVPLYEDKDCSSFYIGRHDKVFRLLSDDSINIGEHKTTSLYKKEGPFQARFLNGFSPNSQIDGYTFAGNMVYGANFGKVYVDAALIHKTMHTGFRFLMEGRVPEMIDGWLMGVRQWIWRMDNDISNYSACKPGDPFLTAFPMNTDQCQGVYGQCGYRDVCRMYPNPMRQHSEGVVPDGFEINFWEPFDVLNIATLLGSCEEGGKDA